MDWSVELRPGHGVDAKMIDLPDFEAVLTCIKDHKAKGDLSILRVHARVRPTEEERVEVIAAGGMPMWTSHGEGSN